MRAQCLIREALHYRRDSFIHGLQQAGYEVVPRLDKPHPEDVLVIWQRYGHFDEVAQLYERAGARVIVAENGYLGKHWLDAEWFALAIGHHAGAGQWTVLDNERWDSLGVDMQPWRTGGTELVILGQRGIGEPGIASPLDWAERTVRRFKGRIRQHPGNHEPQIPLDVDLRNASAVMTWASSAALRALIWGIPVWYEMPKWIGAEASRPLSEYPGEPKMDDAARLSMFRRLAWSQWRMEEIQNGTAFNVLLRRIEIQ